MNYLKNHFPAWICLLFSLNLFSQNVTEIKVHDGPISKVAQAVKDVKNSGVIFTPIHVLEVSKQQQTAVRSKMNGKVQVIEAKSSVLHNLMKEAPSQISFEVPKNDREIIKLHLIKVNPIAEGFNVFTSSEQKVPFNYTHGVYYRGVVEGDENNSLASISMFENEIIGSFTYEGGNMIIQPSYTTPGELILFNDKDISLELPFECLTDQLEKVQKPIKPRGITASGDCVRVYVECDYALYLNKGSTSNTINWITSVFNNLATLYANESINTTISEIFVWTTADTYSKTSSIDALNQFKAARPSFNGDIAHLAALGGNNIGGVAWLDVLCSNYKYAYSNISASYANVPTYSWTVEVMTHEMGHNLGSNHTHWCGWVGGALDNCYTTEGGCAKGPAPTNGGTIMSYCHLTSYGINFNNGFGQQPGDKIRAEVAAANCLGQSCGGTCNAPTGLAISNITQTTATASWNAVSGASSYTFEYKTNSGSTWTVVSTTSPNYNITGLTANTLYNTRVKTVCPSGTSAYSATINFTTLSGCDTPVGLAISNITQTTAIAVWTPVSGANSYSFEYKINSGSTWTVVSTTSPNYNLAGLTPSTLYDTRVKAICSSGSSAYSITVNFTTSGSGTCGTPTGLAISNITQTTATANWNIVQGALSYSFEYKTDAGSTWTVVSTTLPTFNMSGLTAGTLYNTRVKAICTSGSSAYSVTVNFTTSGSGGTCGTPTGLAISNITQTTATANWNIVQGALSYSFEYKTDAGSTWTVVSTTLPTFNMSGLTANTLYNTRVKAICPSGSSSYSVTVNFTTSSAGCGTPTNLAASNITQTTATLSWTPVSGATAYNFQYKLTSGSTWSQSVVTTTVVNLSGLTAGTSYDIRVQTVCGSSTSAFTPVLTFVTSSGGYCVSKGLSTNYEWIKRINLGTIDRNSGKDGGYYDATNLSTNLVKGSTYTINYQCATSGSSGTLYWRVWIDFNKNNSFEDAGEMVVSLASASTGLLSSSFTVPSGASTGTTRMRVAMKYGGFSTSCLTYTYGEVEDYSVNLQASGGLVDPNSEKEYIDNINIYPNPFTNNFHLEFNANQDQDIQLIIMDPLGRVIMSKPFQALAGSNTFNIESSDFVPATYLMQIKSANDTYFRKILKLE